MDIIEEMSLAAIKYAKEGEEINWEGLLERVTEINDFIKTNHKFIKVRKHVEPKTKEYRDNVKSVEKLDEKRDLVWAIFDQGIREMPNIKMLFMFFVSIAPVLVETLDRWVKRETAPLMDLKILADCPFCLEETDLIVGVLSSKIIENVKSQCSPLYGIRNYVCSCGKVVNIVDDILE